jgi:hypothetical protein
MNNKVVPYQIALVGQSGKGKTMSFRNMNPDTCGFINMEGKPLPFVNKFKNYSVPNTWQECYNQLIQFAKEPTITEVVLDSFSAYVDDLLLYARKTKKNFDVWNLHNEEVGKLLYLIKKYPKDIIISGHSMNTEGENGVTERKMAIKGKEWGTKGIESAFTATVFSDVLRDPMSGKANYIMYLNSDGITSAKTPPMFIEEGEDYIENDINAFLERIRTKLSNG